MIECHWVFLTADGGRLQEKLQEPSVPAPGDGKWHDGKGYTVRHVVEGRTTSDAPCVIATETADA